MLFLEVSEGMSSLSFSIEETAVPQANAESSRACSKAIFLFLELSPISLRRCAIPSFSILAIGPFSISVWYFKSSQNVQRVCFLGSWRPHSVH